jgi:2-amino-4-hydroxy-6-hydroxymethyldihydropteridine diphosphokinase
VAIVYLGIGSNLQPADNMRLAVAELKKRFIVREISPVYRNKALGFAGDEFLNAVARVETGMSPADVCRELDEIHDLAGRVRGEQRFLSRTLDIDLLLYGDQVVRDGRVSVPRDDILEYSFVLKPLVDIDPGLRHPLTGKTVAQHWQEFDTSLHPLTEEPAILERTA